MAGRVQIDVATTAAAVKSAEAATGPWIRGSTLRMTAPKTWCCVPLSRNMNHFSAREEGGFTLRGQTDEEGRTDTERGRATHQGKANVTIKPYWCSLMDSGLCRVFLKTRTREGRHGGEEKREKGEQYVPTCKNEAVAVRQEGHG